MNRTFPKPLRTTLTVIAVIVAISAALALTFLGVAQWLPDEISSGRIQWDDHSIALSNVFSGGLLEFLFAFSLMTLAILITVVAMIFAAAVTLVVLAATAGMLALLACVLGFPFLIIVGIVWWSIRRNKRQLATTSTSAQA